MKDCVFHKFISTFRITEQLFRFSERMSNPSPLFRVYNKKRLRKAENDPFQRRAELHKNDLYGISRSPARNILDTPARLADRLRMVYCAARPFEAHSLSPQMAAVSYSAAVSCNTAVVSIVSGGFLRPAETLPIINKRDL